MSRYIDYNNDATARIYYNVAEGDIGKAAERYNISLLFQLLVTTLMITTMLLAGTTIRLTLILGPLWCLIMIYMHSRACSTIYRQLLALQDNERVRAHCIH